MNRILVTGGAGFIGSEFVRQLVEESEHEVVVLDALTYAGATSNLLSLLDNPRLTFVQGDIGDRPLADLLLRRRRVDAIVHFAAESHVDRSIDDPLKFVRTNVLGTCELLDAALSYWETLSEPTRADFRFVHVSTDEVYGSLGADGAFDETSRYAPSSPYAASKAASDHFVRAYARTYALPVVVTNCSNNYGPRQFPEKLIPLTVHRAAHGLPIDIYGDGTNVRDWLHVGDHCRGVRSALECGTIGQTYHFASGVERNNLDMVRAICRIVDQLRPGLPHFPSDSLIRFTADRPGHDFRYALDSSRARGELGWRPLTDFEAGLKETVAWCLDNEAWTASAQRRAGYTTERLGLR